MNWMQILTKEPLPIDLKPPKKKPIKRKKVVDTPTSMRLTAEERDKLRALGGIRWIRRMINEHAV